MVDKSDGQSDITVPAVFVIYFLCTFFMLESLLFAWASRVRWQLFILASVIPVFGFVFYWFCWPLRLWQRTIELPRNRRLFAKIAIIYILLCLGLASAADFMTVRLFGYHFDAELGNLVIPYQFLYFFWLAGTTISMSALLWVALSPLNNEPYEQNLHIMLTTWGDVMIVFFWVLVLSQFWFFGFELVFWLWYLLVSMLLVLAFVGLLRVRSRYRRSERIWKIARIFLGGFSFLAFYKFWENTWQFVVQRDQPGLYSTVPIMFFSMILICWAIGAGIAIVGVPSKAHALK